MAINNSNEAQTGVVGIRIKNKEVVPMGNTKLKVLLEITGDNMGSNSLGADIVAVLDVTKMGEKDLQLKKFDAMRRAMNFLIEKLRPNDCLSIVTFSGATANLELPLSNMTVDCKKEIDELLANRLLVVNGSEEGTSLKSANVVIDGLHTALQVLDKRTITASRVSAIMLVMGTCEPQPETANAIQPIQQIPESNVPVYTFGLGPLYNEEVLYDIAAKSRGGTFSIADVQETLKFNNLTTAFSRCLAGLQTVVAQDVMLTITSTDKCEIEKVSARGYSRPTDNSLNSVTVSFGNLHYQENRKVLVDLVLPAVQNAVLVNVLQISHSYNNNGEVVDTEGTPLFATINRANTTQVQVKEEVAIEEARLKTVAAMGEAISMANSSKFDEARDQIVKTQMMLEDFVDQPKGSTIDALRHELFDLLMLLQTEKIYLTHGRAFGRAAQTSHHHQGATVVSYDTKETKLDPFVTLLYHVERAIMFLEMMQKKVDTFRQVSV